MGAMLNREVYFFLLIAPFLISMMRKVYDIFMNNF